MTAKPVIAMLTVAATLAVAHCERLRGLIVRFRHSYLGEPAGEHHH